MYINWLIMIHSLRQQKHDLLIDLQPIACFHFPLLLLLSRRLGCLVPMVTDGSQLPPPRPRGDVRGQSLGCWGSAGRCSGHQWVGPG